MPKYLTDTKTCTICNENKPTIEFEIYQRKCKKCYSILKREYYLKNNAQKHTGKAGRPKKVIIESTQSSNIL